MTPMSSAGADGSAGAAGARVALAALRIPNADTTSNTPMTISQTPTTMASVRMDSNGEAITTTPAMRLISPMKMFQPLAGRVGSLIGRHRRRDAAEDESDADPDGQQQNRVALAEMAKSENGEDQRRGTADEQQHSATGRDMEAERHDDLRDAGHQQIRAEQDGGDQDRDSRPRKHDDAEDHRQKSGHQSRLPEVWQQGRGSFGSHDRKCFTALTARMRVCSNAREFESDSTISGSAAQRRRHH